MAKKTVERSPEPKRVVAAPSRRGILGSPLLLGLVSLVLTLVVVCVVLVVQVSNSGNASPTPTSTSTSVEKVQRSLSGKSADEDRKDALTSAQNLLNLAAKSPTGANMEARLQALSKGDTSVLDPELVKQVRLVDMFADNATMSANAYQALVTLTGYLNENGKGVAPVSENSWKMVFVDSQAGTAYVPLSAFYQKGIVFSLEMVYVDGTWQFSPYSLLDLVRLSALLQSTGNSTSGG